jgi:succinate dehydrogenase / fumarate reductase cytochrome b subunit
VGKKWAMAVTGIMLMGFVLVHMIGNLHVYEGPERYNAYAEALRELGAGLVPRTYALWALRFGLLLAFVVHVHAAIALTAMNRQSSGASYAARRYSAANVASRSMRWTGLVVLLFLLFHLADLTWGWWLGDAYVRGDVYHNVVRSLSNVPIALLYVAANVALALHLYHGGWSMFQTLGWNHPKFNRLRRVAASTFAGVVLIGNLSFPILTLAGVVDEDDRTTTPCAASDDGGARACSAQRTPGA